MGKWGIQWGIQQGQHILSNVLALLGHFHAKFMERYAEKLRRIMLLQFELITFRFAYGRTIQPTFFTKPTIFIFRDTKIPHMLQANPKSFLKSYSGDFKKMKSEFCLYEKAGSAKNVKTPSNYVLNILNMGLRSSRKHGNFGNIRSIPSKQRIELFLKH